MDLLRGGALTSTLPVNVGLPSREAFLHCFHEKEIGATDREVADVFEVLEVLKTVSEEKVVSSVRDKLRELLDEYDQKAEAVGGLEGINAYFGKPPGPADALVLHVP